MDAIKSFKKYLVESKKAITEQEIPEFTDFEKEILQIGIDNIGNIEVGTSPYLAGDAIYNTDTLTRHSDGIALLNKYQGNEGTGWTGALKYLFEEAENHSAESISKKIAEGNWSSIGTILALYLGADLIRRSEIIELAIKSNQDLTSGDIEDLEDELTLFVGN
tara:strand:+ start:520 stop:1008 length:489 start_codon:yes stop_codon:yes gene_type:complete